MYVCSKLCILAVILVTKNTFSTNMGPKSKNKMSGNTIGGVLGPKTQLSRNDGLNF